MKLSGHFARFNEWAEINSRLEGHFLERISPGAFSKTLNENRGRVRVLLNHGNDPELGDRPLGPIEELREDDHGAFYRVSLLEGLPTLVASGLREKLYGASFRFETLREEFQQRPGRSTWNPRGLPERTLKEVRVREFGPVTWPAYEGATAHARSTGDSIWLPRATGRIEDVPVLVSRRDALGHGPTPLTVRRLRASGSTRAAQLVRALDRGEVVEITWGRTDFISGRVLERGRRRSTYRGEPWRLP